MMATTGNEKFDWESLVPRVLHPMQVEIIEAMVWIGRPLSASELRLVFEEAHGLSHVAYHVDRLADLKALRKAGGEQVRGTYKSYYVLIG
jgi:hypothetical protein